MKTSIRFMLLRNKATLSIAVAIGVSSGLFVVAAPQSSAQEDSSALWNKFSEVDSRISASRTTWDAVFSVPAGEPISEKEIGIQVKQAEEKARQSGETEADARQVGQIARKTLQSKGKNFSARTQLNFVRVGSKIHCDINFVEAKTRAIEIFDGQNSVFLETQVNGIKYSPMGSLQRDTGEILKHSAPTWQTARFLTGIPFSQKLSPPNPTFSPEDTLLKKEGNLLTHLTRLGYGKGNGMLLFDAPHLLPS